MLLYGSLIFGGAFSFVYYAFVRIHAGLGQTLLALVPLATLLLAVLQRQERLRLAAVVGTLFSVAGIGVISGLSGGESVPVLSPAGGAGRRAVLRPGDGGCPALPTRPPGDGERRRDGRGRGDPRRALLLLKQSIVLPEDGATWLALAYMVVLGSGPVFVLYVVVVRLWSASRAAYSFVLIPLVAILLSAWIDEEPIGAELLVGGLLVLAGVYIGALRPAASPAPQTDV